MEENKVGPRELETQDPDEFLQIFPETPPE
jgi:hypothetical protein